MKEAPTYDELKRQVALYEARLRTVGATTGAPGVTEHVLRLLADNLPQLVWIASADGTPIWLNKRFLAFMGDPADALSDARLARLHHPARITHVRSHYRACIAAGIPCEDEVQLMGPDGGYHWFLSRAVPLRDEHGAIINWLGTHTDITEQHRSQEERRLSDEKYRAIISSSDDAIISKDLQGIITSWNKGAERIFGYTEEEMIGQPLLKLIPPELHHEEVDILERIGRGERVDHFETVRMNARGERLHISVTISPLRDEHGRVSGASKVARDITAQKHAIDRIRESEEKFTTMFRNAPVGIVLTDAATGAIVDANPAFMAMLGLDLEELRSIDLLASGVHRHPEQRERVMTLLTEQGHLRDEEVTLYDRQGRRKEVLLNATPVQVGPKPHMLVHVEDITARKEAELALRQADRRKDEFLATLAHELRNPLAPLSNALQLLDLAGDDPATGEQARRMMARQLEHMVHLVDDLMDLSRITRGVIDLRLTTLDLGNILAQAVEATRPQLDRQGHALDVSPPGQACWVKGDGTRLVQVFSNLLSNAAKYTDPGGRIRLSATCKGDQATITVRDNGIGIAATQLDRVFDMFAQLEPNSARSRSGLGIGLSIVQQLVTLHGGTIRADSPGLGHGSTFEVVLPLIAAPTPGSGDDRNEGSEGRGLRILVTDDNTDAALMLALVLRKLGHAVRTVHNGHDALAALEGFRPDVVFLDIGMPEMDGYETCRRIRRSDTGRSAHIVALTGWGQEEDKRLAREAGFDKHLVKPVARRTLLDALADIATG